MSSTPWISSQFPTTSSRKDDLTDIDMVRSQETDGSQTQQHKEWLSDRSAEDSLLVMCVSVSCWPMRSRWSAGRRGLLLLRRDQRLDAGSNCHRLCSRSTSRPWLRKKEINAFQPTSSRGEVENLVLGFNADRAKDAKLKDRDSARRRKPGVQFVEEVDEATHREDCKKGG